MAVTSFQHLKIKTSLWWRIKFFALFLTQKLFYRIPLLGKICRRLESKLSFLGKLEKKEKQKIRDLELLKNPCPNPQDPGSSYGYENEMSELNSVQLYHDQIKKPNFKIAPAESYFLYEHIIKRLNEVLKDNDITSFVNFGVCYAHIDSILAKSHPHVKFVGVDRSSFTKLYNEKCFNLPNLEYYIGDIMELITKNKFENGIFFHTRTMVLFAREFVIDLYKAVKKAGFKYIIGMEQVGISRQTFKSYEFSYEMKPSILYRSKMYIHNYPAILKELGYNLQDIQLVKTNHAHKDYRIISYTGKRNG